MQASTETPGAHLVLFDGVCGLCNRLNAFLLARDTRGVFVFASLQSAAGRAALRRFGPPDESGSTFYVLAGYRSTSPVLLAKSEAALFVLRALGAPWRWAAFVGVLPRRLLDAGYELIARTRYRIFGQHPACPAPDPRYRGRFLDV